MSDPSLADLAMREPGTKWLAGYGYCPVSIPELLSLLEREGVLWREYHWPSQQLDAPAPVYRLVTDWLPREESKE